MLKPPETVYIANMNSNIYLQLEKIFFSTNENFILRRTALTFQTPNFNVL